MAEITNEQIMEEVRKLRTEIEIRDIQLGPIIKAYNDGILPVCRIEQGKVTALELEVKILKEKLIGNGKPGLILEVDRLNQTMNQIRWLGGLTLAAVIGQIVYTLFTVVGKIP